MAISQRLVTSQCTCGYGRDLHAFMCICVFQLRKRHADTIQHTITNGLAICTDREVLCLSSDSEDRC